MVAQLYPALIDLTLATVLLRLLLAVLCGGAVGLERERKGRPAGFRTHILVCLGAALCMMTNQYLLQFIGQTDTARLGAGVISGISFLGAGTIMVTGQRQVKGLTTAAGLWASAAMGLAIGVGFYEAALMACVVIFAVERLLRGAKPRRERVKRVDLYLELQDTHALGELIAMLREREWKVEDIDIIKSETAEKPSLIVFASLRGQKPVHAEDVLTMLRSLDSVLCAEEM
ncbi:MAG: MgtC/SapB family protein [Eubacteriales bacterium]|nr:MgtC/SapB family protein [Eubacteriales bacterium]